MDVNDFDELRAAMDAAVKEDHERELNAFIRNIRELRSLIINSIQKEEIENGS